MSDRSFLRVSESRFEWVKGVKRDPSTGIANGFDWRPGWRVCVEFDDPHLAQAFAQWARSELDKAQGIVHD